MTTQIVDSHAHLDFSQFDDDREAVVQRARNTGLAAILNVGTDLASSRAAVALAERYDFVYATVGVHPHDAKTVTPGVLEALWTLADHPKVVAVGEIGLDYYRDLSPRPVQRRAFVEQLALAADLGLPVVIHSRDAHDGVLATLQSWEGVGVFHSYAAGPKRLNEVLDLGFYVGISGPVTFRNAHSLREVASTVPLDRLLVETDAPFLTPVPHRGHRNEPAYVRHVVTAIARERGISFDVVAERVTENFRCLFGVL